MSLRRDIRRNLSSSSEEDEEYDVTSSEEEKEEEEVGRRSRLGYDEFTPIDVSEDDVDENSDTEPSNDVFLPLPSIDYAISTLDDGEEGITYAEDGVSGAFQRVRASKIRKHVPVQEGRDEEDRGQLDEDDNRTFARRKNMESLLETINFVGQGLLSGVSLSMILLFMSYANEDADFLVFFSEWASTVHHLHFILLTLYASELVDKLIYRRSKSDDKGHRRWSVVSDTITLLVLCAIVIVAFVLCLTMNKLDCHISTWKEYWQDGDTACFEGSCIDGEVEIWSEWLAQGGQSSFDVWKRSAIARASLLLVSWIMLNAQSLSRRRTDENQYRLVK